VLIGMGIVNRKTAQITEKWAVLTGNAWQRERLTKYRPWRDFYL